MEAAVNVRWCVYTSLPLLVSTAVMACKSSAALDSEYSTNTSNSFRAVFTTSRNYTHTSAGTT